MSSNRLQTLILRCFNRIRVPSFRRRNTITIAIDFLDLLILLISHYLNLGLQLSNLLLIFNLLQKQLIVVRAKLTILFELVFLLLVVSPHFSVRLQPVLSLVSRITSKLFIL